MNTEENQPAVPRVKSGNFVEHEIFGRGIVGEVERGTGQRGEDIVTVLFPTEIGASRAVQIVVGETAFLHVEDGFGSEDRS